MRYFIYAIIGIVAVAIIAGFFIVGSPQQERLRRFDDRRVQDLQNIQSEIRFYWQSKGKLPENLAAMNYPLQNITIPRDPQTAEDYGYEAKGPLIFSICATFSLPSQTVGARVTPKSPAAPGPVSGFIGDQNFSHVAGHVCFDRTIDPDFDKPQPAPPVKGR